MRRDITGLTTFVASGIVLVVVHTAQVVGAQGEVVSLVANLVLATGLVHGARRRGFTNAQLGLTVERGSWRFALGAAATIVGLVAVVARLGFLPVDPTAAELSTRDIWFRALVAIPLGTAICEEVMFRGVLLAVGDRTLGRPRSTLAVGALFGLWHIGAETSRTGSMGWGVVPGVIATAAVSALVLCPLRRRTGDLLASVAVHAATNVVVFVAVVLTSRGGA